MNACSPSCAAGTSSKLAVSGAGPLTIVATPFALHVTPDSSHTLPGASAIVMLSGEDGSTVTSQRRFDGRARCRAPVTRPPVTSSSASRTVT